MKKLFIVGGLFLGSYLSNAQSKSLQAVDYMITKDENSQRYIAWVVPSYNTPNSYNPDTEERGATAQFSIQVPKGTILSSVKDLAGNWEKNPSKIDAQSHLAPNGIKSNFDYYIIGKTPTETNYGKFAADEPVALFSFVLSNAGNSSQVKVLDSNDEFVKTAMDKLSLNVASSFYSRSGQAPRPDVIPAEQFNKPIDEKGLMKRIAAKYEENNLMLSGDESPKMVAYPNPVVERLTVRFFSNTADEQTTIKMVDALGNEMQSKAVATKLGMNTVTLDVAAYQSASYSLFLQNKVDKTSKKIVKN